MKVAITADLHLKTKVENTERYNALINILDQLLSENINNLIIAGDLFEINSQNYSIFDELCKQKKYNQIEFFIIPGNHDSNIKSKYFTANNIKIFNEPTIIALGDPAINFFFVPYILNKPMGEIIASFKDTLIGPWLLIGHGDYRSRCKRISAKPNLDGVKRSLLHRVIRCRRRDILFLFNISDQPSLRFLRFFHIDWPLNGRICFWLWNLFQLWYYNNSLLANTRSVNF